MYAIYERFADYNKQVPIISTSIFFNFIKYKIDR